MAILAVLYTSAWLHDLVPATWNKFKTEHSLSPMRDFWSWNFCSTGGFFHKEKQLLTNYPKNYREIQ
jgi:hypothetical protein